MKLKKVLSGFMAAVIAVTSSVVMTVSSSAANTVVASDLAVEGTFSTNDNGNGDFTFDFPGYSWASTLNCDDYAKLEMVYDVTDKGNGAGLSVVINSGDSIDNGTGWVDVSNWNLANGEDQILTIDLAQYEGKAFQYIGYKFYGASGEEFNGNITIKSVTLVVSENIVNLGYKEILGESALTGTFSTNDQGNGDFTVEVPNYAWNTTINCDDYAAVEMTYDVTNKGNGAALSLVINSGDSIDNGTGWVDVSNWNLANGENQKLTIDLTQYAGKAFQYVAYKFYGTSGEEFNGDITIKAIRFINHPATNEITISDTIENGTVTAEPTEAAEGETVTLTATHDEGYVLDTLTVTGASGEVDVADDYTFTMPAEEVTVSATFKAIDYTLTAATADGGSIYFHVDGNIAETANVGDAVYVIIEADDYYNLSSATANGVPVEACLFKMPAENVTVTPVFELDIEELKTDVDAALTSAILEATQPSAYTVANLNTAIVNALAEINEAVALTVDTSALTLKASTEEATGSITGTVTVKAGDTTITTATANVTLNKIPANPVEVAYEAIVAYLETVTFDNDFHATKQAEAITALVAEKAPDARVDPSFNVIVADYENAGAVKGTIKIIADGCDSKTITVDKVIAVLEKTDEMLLEEAVAATETAIKDIATADGITKDVVTKAIANEDVTVTVKSEETKAPTTTEKGVQTVTITLKLGTLTETVTKTFDIDMLEVTDEMIMEEAAAAAEDAIKAITSADEITAAAIEEAIANEDVTVTVKSEETKAPTTTAKGVQTVTITLTVGDVTETITKTFDIDMLPAGYQDAANTTIPEGKTVTQKTVVEDGVYSQRFIKKVSAEDLVGATKIVFTVSNGTKTATYESTKCYSSLNVNGGSLSAGDDYVFLGLTIKDIPENITVTIEDIEIVY